MIQIALLASLVALTQAPRPAAKPSVPDLNAPTAVDPQPDKAAFRVVTDGKQHFFAFTFAKEEGEGITANGQGIPKAVYWSADGKAFFMLRVFGGGAEGSKSFDVYFFEPRIRTNSSFDFKDGKFQTNCGDKRVELQPLAPEQAKATLEGATFYKMRWTRKPYALSRDEKGTYYFVDHLRDDDGHDERRRDFRLFVGPRGQMKEQKMTNLVSDSEGDIFGTKSGDFRLVLNKEGQRDSKWVQSGKEVKLTSVPLLDNLQVIYNDLGVYERAKLGTPCDEY